MSNHNRDNRPNISMPAPTVGDVVDLAETTVAALEAKLATMMAQLAAAEQGRAAAEADKATALATAEQATRAASKVKLHESGAIMCSVGGKWPVQLFKDQWQTVLDNLPEIRAIIAGQELPTLAEYLASPQYAAAKVARAQKGIKAPTFADLAAKRAAETIAERDRIDARR